MALPQLPQQQQYLYASSYQPPWWYTTGQKGIGFGARETQRKLFRKGIKRRGQNFAQYKGTMLPIKEAELNEAFASRGMFGSSLRQRSLTKLREPYRRHEQALANQYSLAKEGTRKHRIWDIIDTLW